MASPGANCGEEEVPQARTDTLILIGRTFEGWHPVVSKYIIEVYINVILR
jgi:hypothetical protein